MRILHGSRPGKMVVFADMIQYYYTDCSGYQEFCEPIFESCIYHCQAIAFYNHGKRDIKHASKSSAISIKYCYNCERISRPCLYYLYGRSEDSSNGYCNALLLIRRLGRRPWVLLLRSKQFLPQPPPQASNSIKLVLTGKCLDYEKKLFR